MLIDNYGGIIASVVRNHLGTLINYEEECINDVLLSIWESINGYDKDKNTFKIGYVPLLNINQLITEKSI